MNVNQPTNSRKHAIARAIAAILAAAVLAFGVCAVAYQPVVALADGGTSTDTTDTTTDTTDTTNGTDDTNDTTNGTNGTNDANGTTKEPEPTDSTDGENGGETGGSEPTDTASTVKLEVATSQVTLPLNGATDDEKAVKLTVDPTDASVTPTSSKEDVATVKYEMEKGVVVITPKKVGEAEVTVTATKGTATESKKVKVKVTANRQVAKPTVKAATGLVFSGASQVGITVSGGVEGSYTVKGDQSATNAGDYTARIEPNDGYEWDDATRTAISQKWSIAAVSIQKAVISGVADQKYTGSDIKPEVTVKVGETTLKKDVDYSVAYASNRVPGTATITVTGVGNYQGTASATFTIVPAENVKVKVSDDKVTYDAYEHALTISAGSNIKSNKLQLRYSKDKGKTYTLETAPEFADAGKHKVYYQATDIDGILGTTTGVATLAITASDTVTDEDSGIVATGKIFTKYTTDNKIVELRVDTMSDDDDDDVAKRVKALKNEYYEQNNTQLFKVYDISLVLVDTVADTETAITSGFGDLTITFPVGKKYNKLPANIYELHKTGNSTKVIAFNKLTVKNAALSVTVDKLSEFVVRVNKTASTSTKGNSSNSADAAKKGSTVTKTYDTTDPYLPVGVAVVAVALAVVAVRRVWVYRNR